MSAVEATNKSDEVKVAILLHAIGEEAQEKFETFELTTEQQGKYNDVIMAFEKYCVPKKNESVNRHQFFQRTQKQNETFNEFLTDLKKLSLDCAFGDMKDSLVRDRIISGINDTLLKNRLLREENLTLEKCTQICRIAELASENLETLKSKETVNVIQRKSQQKEKISKPTKTKKDSESEEKEKGYQH